MKRNSNIKLMRVADGFLPAALLIASLTSQNSPAFTLAICSLAVEALSLFSSHGVRIAFARQPAMRDVRGSVKCALLLQCLATAIAAAGQWLIIHKDSASILPLIGAAGLLNIEHTFYEYLAATGDRRSATLCQALAALLTLTGLLLADTNPTITPWIPAMAGLSAIMACAVSAVMGDGLRGKMNAQVLRCAPRAALQGMFYPLVAFVMVWFFLPTHALGTVFAGLTLYELCRTPFRRSRLETPTMNRALAATLLICAAALIALRFVPALSAAIAPHTSTVLSLLWMLIAASGCAFAVFGNINV